MVTQSPRSGLFPSCFLVILWISLSSIHVVHSSKTEWDIHDIILHPAKRSIVLVGHRTSIRVYCEQLSQDICLSIRAADADIIEVLSSEVNISRIEDGDELEQKQQEHHDFSDNPDHDLHIIEEITRGVTEEDIVASGQIRLLGLKPGSTRLKIDVLHESGDEASTGNVSELLEDYIVTVVRRVDVVQDAFMYVLSTAQVLVLFLLGWRMRSAAVKEVLCRPCTLIAAILCQTMLVPLVTLGASIALSLPVHSVVSLLIVGCCPTGVLSPMFAVLQQAHVELGIVLLLVETAAAFGAMPLWLFTYGHFLGLAYTNVAFPYLHIAGALVAVAGPIVLGLVLQRCTPRLLPGVDKAIQPTCLLLVLVACTVRSHAMWRHWELVTWRLALSCGLVALAGTIMGGVATGIFRQKLPQVKTVAIVTSLQNTLLATVILQTSFPAPDASLMAVTITTLEVMSQALMIILYIIHVAVWLSWPFYRSRHDSIGISGAYRSIGERIVKSMIKAGEITMLKATNSSPKSKCSSGSSSAGISTATGNIGRPGHIPILVPGKDGFKFGTIGMRKSGFSSSLDTICRSQISLVGSSVSTGELSLRYFASSAEASPRSQPRSEPDSLSIDYAMLLEEKPKFFLKTADDDNDNGDDGKTEVKKQALDDNGNEASSSEQRQQREQEQEHDRNKGTSQNAVHETSTEDDMGSQSGKSDTGLLF